MKPVPNYVPHLIAMMPDHHREQIEERAAIREFCGKQSREEAEQQALIEWQHNQRVVHKGIVRDIQIREIQLDRKSMAAGEK